MARGRHGDARKRQQELRRGRVTGFRRKGIKKKMEGLSIERLWVMFPMYGNLSDAELRKKAEEEMKKR